VQKDGDSLILHQYKYAHDLLVWAKM
jgi:hypothetical protein